MHVQELVAGSIGGGTLKHKNGKTHIT